MILQDSPHRSKPSMRWPPALGGADLIEIFCGEHGHEQASPVGDGVAEEGAEVRAWCGASIEDDPRQQNGGRHDAERVLVQKAVSAFRHGASMHGLGTGLL